MYEIYSFMRRISSCSLICDISDIYFVVNENGQKTTFLSWFFTATWWATVALKIWHWEVNLRSKLHFSCIDWFVVPPIFKYLIGAKDAEIRLSCTFTWYGSSATFFCHSPPNTNLIATFSTTNMSTALKDSLASRLNKLNLVVIDVGFASLANALIHEINCFSDCGALGKRAVTFYK